MTLSLNEACEEVTVYSPEDLHDNWYETAQGPCPHPEGYWGVSGELPNADNGALCYFPTERLAFRYRLSLINRLLNG